MGDRPDKLELLDAVRNFLDGLIPELEGVNRFHARVSSNVLAIVSREIALEGEVLPRLYTELAALLDADPDVPGQELDAAVDALESALQERIRAGDADAGPFREGTLRYLTQSVRERLSIANPTYR